MRPRRCPYLLAEPGFNEVPGASGENLEAFLPWRARGRKRLAGPLLLGHRRRAGERWPRGPGRWGGKLPGTVM